MPLTRFAVLSVQVDVVATDYFKKKNLWLFKPVYDVSLFSNYGDYAHPLAGYRQFDVVSADNNQTFSFFTRGVERPYGLLNAAISGTIFKGANKLWNAVISNVVSFANSMGGEAMVGSSLSKQTSWSKDVSDKDRKK